jgi:uncharacterized protein YggE
VATVSVRGEAVLEREPDRVDLYLNVQARDPDRARALAALTERGAALQAVVVGLGPGVERYASTGFNVYPQFSDTANDELRGYEGRASLMVTLADFELLPRLISGANEIELSSVAHLSWRMRRDSPVFREARLAAVDDALLRAQDYAAAFRARITGLIEVTDSGLTVGAAYRPRATAFAAGGRGAEGTAASRASTSRRSGKRSPGRSRRASRCLTLSCPNSAGPSPVADPDE